MGTTLLRSTKEEESHDAGDGSDGDPRSPRSRRRLFRRFRRAKRVKRRRRKGGGGGTNDGKSGLVASSARGATRRMGRSGGWCTRRPRGIWRRRLRRSRAGSRGRRLFAHRPRRRRRRPTTSRKRRRRRPWALRNRWQCRRHVRDSRLRLSTSTRRSLLPHASMVAKVGRRLHIPVDERI